MRADRYTPLSTEKMEHWSQFPQWDPAAKHFNTLLGFVLEDVRIDYARLRLPYRPELNQPAGVMHGGAIASLIDTAVVPAIGAYYDEMPRMLTISLTVNYLGAIIEEDAVCEGWVERRGKSIVFCTAEVWGVTSGKIAANASLVYKV
jgi:uncharacterized protein (TIGR00369 family)